MRSNTSLAASVYMCSHSDSLSIARLPRPCATANSTSATISGRSAGTPSVPPRCGSTEAAYVLSSRRRSSARCFRTERSRIALWLNSMRGCFTSLLSSRVSRFRALIAIHSCIPIPMRVPGNTSEFAFDWPFAAEFGRKSQTIEYVTVCAAIEGKYIFDKPEDFRYD